MKKILLSLLLLTTTLLGTAQVTGYSIGEVVDDFTVTDVHGVTHNLYEITASGKHVYLDFFFDTCGPCQGASPHFGDFYDKYGCNAYDVYCLVINNGTDSDAETIAYEEAFGGSGHHAPAVSADGGGGAVDAAFGIGAYPTFCMIGPDNKLVESDIWPVSDVSNFEATFYGDFNPEPAPCSLASIQENDLIALNVYPNPASNQATITFSNSVNEKVTIQAYNMIGEVIYTSQLAVVSGVNQIQLDLQDFRTGNYLIQITSENTLTTSKLEVIK